MLFSSPTSSLALLVVVAVATHSVSARPLPSYEIPSSSSLQLVGRQDALLEFLGLDGDATDAAAAVEDGGSGTTTSALVKGTTTTTVAVAGGKETSAVEEVATTKEGTTTSTAKASVPTTTLTTAKQAQITTSQAVVVVGTQTTANAVATSTPSSSAAASILPNLSSAVLASSPATSTSTSTSTALVSADAQAEDLVPAASSLASLASHSTSLRPSASASANSTLLSSNLSTSLSPFSPKSSLFPLLLPGLILGSLLALGLVFLVVKRVVIPSSKKSKRWGSKEGEDVLPWNELGGTSEEDLTHGRGLGRSGSGRSVGGRSMMEVNGSTRIGETAYPYPQQQRGIASSEGGGGPFVLGSYQSSAFDRDARMLPDPTNYYGANGGGGGDQVVGWGDAIGAMENRTRGVGGVGAPPPVCEDPGRQVAIGGGARRERSLRDQKKGAGGR